VALNVFGNVGEVVLGEGARLLENDHEMLGGGQVWHVQHGSESGQHFHVLEHLAPAAGADDQQLPALGRFLLKQHQECLQRQIRIPRSDGAVVQEALDVVHQDAAQHRTVGVIEDLPSKMFMVRCKDGISEGLTFRIERHLADSVKPTISSGEQTLTKGKSELLANSAARAVLPELGGPSSSTDTRPEPSACIACWMSSWPSSIREDTGLPQLMTPRPSKWSRASALVPKAYNKEKMLISKLKYLPISQK
jgi:hypothetical protein